MGFAACLLVFLVILTGSAAAGRLEDLADPAGEGLPVRFLAWRAETPCGRDHDLPALRGPENLDPGAPPEGDYVGGIAFTPDGQRVLVTNRLSDNITLFDGYTATALDNVGVGTYPRDLAVSNEFAVVACTFSDEVYVIDMETTAVAAIFPVSPQPAEVRLSADGRYAYIACDTDDVCEVIDLHELTHVHTIEGFPVEAYSSWVVVGNGRFGWIFNDFLVSPDGLHLIVGDLEDEILFFNSATGEIEHTIDAERIAHVALSGDGETVVAVSTTIPPVIHQIDLDTHAITATVTPTGYWAHAPGTLAVNADGSKAMVGSTSNKSVIIRFDSLDSRTLSETGNPFWLGVSPDHHLAICGNRLSVVDFTSESVIGQVGDRAGGVLGAVSPVGERLAAHDPAAYEGVSTFDYSGSTAPVFHGRGLCGWDPEGDAPKRVVITPDGVTALALNTLSENIVVLDLATSQNRAFIPLPGPAQPAEIAVTSDSRWAVVSIYNRDAAAVIDLLTCAVVCTVPTGEHPTIVSVSPDDRYAFIGNTGSNSVSVIELAGENSVGVVEIPCGVIGWLGVAYGLFSDVRVSPTGDYVLVTASFDDRIDVIDTTTMTIVASLPLRDFPFRVCFTPDGEYAIVTNFNDNSFSVIHVDGAASSVITNVHTNSRPLSVVYDPIEDEMWVATYSGKTVYHVDPRTGEVLDQDYYNEYGSIIQILVDAAGEPIVLTTDEVLVEGAPVALPGSASQIAYSPMFRRSVITIPGPDFLTVVGSGPSIDIATGPLAGWNPRVRSFSDPNPCTSDATIHFHLRETRLVQLQILDVAGRAVTCLADAPFAPGDHALEWNTAGQASGTYFYRLKAGSEVVAGKILLAR